MARKVVRSAGWFLTCLDALEAAEDMASLRGPFADLAAALQSLGGLTARGLKARILKWFAIPFSSGHFVRTLHHDQFHLGWPYRAWLIVLFS